MSRNFNREQQRVIEATGGYHMVLAPPGCGKTAVLAERIVWANEHGVDFQDMACLTFTNRASRSMKDRISERLPHAEGLDSLFVGNVHRFCSRFLFESGTVPEHTTVIDTDTAISIIADILGEDELQILGDAKGRQRYSQIINLQHLLYQCAHHYPGTLMVHREALTATLLKELCLAFGLPYSQDSTIKLYEDADAYLQRQELMSGDARRLLQAMRTAGFYERYKQQNDLVDFEDLLLFSYDRLSANSDIKRYRWLQIDEVQDLNPLQLAIVDLFTEPDATVVYLGDPQQAIFSFMGTRTNTLDELRKRCTEDHFYNFFVNYRSPKYLLDVFNHYGEHQLKIAPQLLPATTNLSPKQPGDLQLLEAETNVDEANMVARHVREVYETYPDDSVAVVVASNTDADEVGSALGDLPHFKVSGVDFFTLPDVKLLLAHLGVVAMEHNFIAWSQLFTGLQVYSSNSASRQFVRALMELAISPVDFIDYESSTYIAQFVEAYEKGPVVVFDTETTGLNVFEDDVVQLAAIKVKQGRVVDELNLFIETSREIPAMLGDVPNPLIEEYQQQPHLTHAEALRRFVDFAKGCAILGHNATYDYQIMEHNMRRYAPQLSMYALWPDYFDTLKLVRLLRPRLKSYKLKDLLEELKLEGENSHLASDDIVATRSVMVYAYDRARSIVGRQQEFIGRHRKVIDRFRTLYADLYRRTREQLYVEVSGQALPLQLQYAYDYLLDIRKVGLLPKLPYLMAYIREDMLTPASGSSLAQQLAAHMNDLSTMKEADLCGAQSMHERVFVSTVHKAKGLEFDHVVVYDAVEGKYPSFYASASDDGMEEARKFYVAISRARKRLVVSTCRQAVTRWGRQFTRQQSRYLSTIRDFFE